jgi:tetratricopeptide (TPR) repeat protein
MDTTFTEDVFAWLESETPRLQAEGGLKREFLDLFCDFLEAFSSPKKFDLAQSALFQAIKLAETASELFWCLFLRHNLVLFWLSYDVLRLALPEAFSLLSLLNDEVLHESPHLSHSYHDIISCYLLLDPVGYYKEIMAHSQNLLTQVPADHTSALFAYRHMMLASASAGHAREAEHWLSLLQSLAPADDCFFDIALTYEYLERWPQAKHYYQEAVQRIPFEDLPTVPSMMALLGVARAHCALYEITEAANQLSYIYSLLAWFSRPLLLARLFVVEAHLALACDDIARAVSFLTQSARISLEFTLFRDAAHSALQAAELARSAHLPEPIQALSFASQAARMLPPASFDIVQRLRSFSHRPAFSPSETLLSAEPMTQDLLEEREMAVLKTSLRVSLASGHFPLVSLLLFMLARVYLEQGRELRQVINYLVWHIALERFRASSLSLDSSLSLLSTLRDDYDLADEVDEALFALASAPPPAWLTWLCEDLSADRWGALITSLLHFLSGDSLFPVVKGSH